MSEQKIPAHYAAQMRLYTEQAQTVKPGHFVRSVASGRLGCVREVTDHGYVVKFGSARGTTFVRFDAVTPT